MKFSFSLTDVVAWWGAAVATSLLIWDVYKYKNAGAKLKFRISPNMKFAPNPFRKQSEETLVVLRVVNTGDRPTTITTVALQQYQSRWSKWRKKPKQTFLVPNPVISQPLPYVLNPGQEWGGGIEQTEDLEQWAKNGHLYCLIYHATETKPIEQRVVITESVRTALQTNENQTEKAA